MAKLSSTVKFYNRFALFYPLVDLFLKPQKKILAKEVNQLPIGKLLEIGIGNGSHLPYYKNHEIIGIDISSAMLKKAANYDLKNVTLLEMNAEEMTFEDQSFDYIVMSHVITVTSNPEKLMEQAYRVLKPGGKLFLLNHFTPPNFLRHIDHIFQYIGSLFHLRSKFSVQDLPTLQKFKLQHALTLGKFSYFKLLIYQK